MNENQETGSDLLGRYLVFRVGSELYGTPLLEVREVVEYQEPKFMPNMASFFSGVINIRGTIVGVVDLRARFGAPNERSRQTGMLVCETEQGPIAAIVDQVESVQSISEQEIERKPPIVSKFRPEYLVGVAKLRERLVTLIHLKDTLSGEKLAVAS